MFSKRNVIVTTMVTAGAALLILTQTAGSKGEANKLEGAWVCTVQAPPPLQTMQWTMALAPTDPSGRAAIVSGSIQVPVPPGLLCPATGQTAPPVYEFTISRDYMGEAVMTGPNTTRATMIGYSLNDQGQVAFIWMGAGEMKFTAPGKAKGTSTLAYYLPETDTNHDGIPEGAPFCVLGPSDVDMTRLGTMPLPGLEQ